MACGPRASRRRPRCPTSSPREYVFQNFCARDFLCGSGCLSGIFLSRYLMSVCPFYPAAYGIGLSCCSGADGACPAVLPVVLVSGCRCSVLADHPAAVSVGEPNVADSDGRCGRHARALSSFVSQGACQAGALRSGDGPLSVRVRPSSLKRDCDRRATSTGGKCLVIVHAKSRLTLEPLRTLRPETTVQAGACPDRARAIPCKVRTARTLLTATYLARSCGIKGCGSLRMSSYSKRWILAASIRSARKLSN